MEYQIERTFEKKLAQYIFITIISLNTYGIINHIIYGGKPINAILVIISWLFYVFLFCIGQVKQQFDEVINPLITSLLLLLTIFWISMGGLKTAIPYLFLIATLLSVIISPAKQRLIVICVYVGIQIVLILLEIYTEYSIISEPTPQAIASVPIVLIVCSITAAYLAFNLKSNFDLEREILRQQSLVLMEKGKIIHKQNESIMQINQTLEERVARRTHDLEELNQQLMDYAFYNAHKVRGPLCRIMGLVLLIRQAPEPLNQDLLDKLDVATQELDAVVGAINEILHSPNKKLHIHQKNSQE